MPMIKFGTKQGADGDPVAVYMLVGNVVRDGEIRQAGKYEIGCASVAAQEKPDGSTVFVTVNGWRDKAEIVSAACKGDAVLAVGVLKTREHNGKTYYDLDADFIAKSGAGLMQGAPRASAKLDDAATSWADDAPDDDDGGLPF